MTHKVVGHVKIVDGVRYSCRDSFDNEFPVEIFEVLVKDAYPIVNDILLLDQPLYYQKSRGLYEVDNINNPNITDILDENSLSSTEVGLPDFKLPKYKKLQGWSSIPNDLDKCLKIIMVCRKNAAYNLNVVLRVDAQHKFIPFCRRI